MLGHSSRELCWENIWSIYTCLKAVLLYFSSMPWPKIRHLFPLRYLKLDLTVKWVIGGILRRYFSCLNKGEFTVKEIHKSEFTFEKIIKVSSTKKIKMTEGRVHGERNL